MSQPNPSNRMHQSPSFLDNLRIDYGPPDLLADYFSHAEAECADLGLTLSFATADELLCINQANRDSWRPLIGVFNPEHGGITTGNTFAVVGRDGVGRAVAVHAGRLFDWSDGQTFHSEGSSMRMFYSDPERMKLEGENCTITAQYSHHITGRVVFSGAAWIHPTFRGKGLSHIFPKLGKALAFTRFSPDFIASTMIEDIHARGFAPRFDYTNVDWDIHLKNSHMGDWRLAVVSMEGPHIIDVIRNYLDASALSHGITGRKGRA